MRETEERHIKRKPNQAATKPIGSVGMHQAVASPTSTEVEQQQQVLAVGPMDVLMGRGSNFQPHVGNILYRILVKDFAGEYIVQECYGRDIVARKLVGRINSSGGRFLQRSGDAWVTCNPKLVIGKVKQALRDANRQRKSRREYPFEEKMAVAPDCTGEVNALLTEKISDCSFGAVDYPPESELQLRTGGDTVMEQYKNTESLKESSGGERNAFLSPPLPSVDAFPLILSHNIPLDDAGKYGKWYSAKTSCGVPPCFFESTTPLNFHALVDTWSLLSHSQNCSFSTPPLNGSLSLGLLPHSFGVNHEECSTFDGEMEEILRKLREGVHHC